MYRLLKYFKILPVFAYYWLLSRVQIGGRWYHARRSDCLTLIKAAAHANYYESDTSEILVALLKLKEGSLIDVGANIGQTLIKFLKLAPMRPYIGFEPQLAAATSLSAFVHDNQLRDHRIVPVGLASKCGLLPFGVRSDFDTAGSFALEKRPKEFYSKITFLPVFTGDSALAEMSAPPPAVIKIDVEGAEMEVLEGFRQTIAAHQPAIIFECLPQILRSTGERLSPSILNSRENANMQISAFFKDAGYDIFQLLVTGKLGPATSVKSHATGVLNYVAVPSGLAVKVQDATGGK